jgi:hypothetical protein
MSLQIVRESSLVSQYLDRGCRWNGHLVLSVTRNNIALHQRDHHNPPHPSLLDYVFSYPLTYNAPHGPNL